MCHDSDATKPFLRHGKRLLSRLRCRGREDPAVALGSAPHEIGDAPAVAIVVAPESSLRDSYGFAHSRIDEVENRQINHSELAHPTTDLER